MQREPAERDRVGRGIAVHGVAEHRVSEVREVDPDLVGSPRAELGLDQRHRTEALQGAQHGPGEPSAGPRRERGPPGSGAGPADAPLHELLPRQLAADERQVAPVHGMGSKLAVQVFRGGVREGEDEEPRRVAVETVDDEDTVVPPGPAFEFSRGARQHRVDFALTRGVDDEAGRLADHEDVGIRVDYLDRQGLRGASAPGQRRVVRHGVGRRHERARVRRHRPVQEHVADEDLAFGARIRTPDERLCRSRETSILPGHARSLPSRGDAGGQPRARRGRVSA